MAAGGPGIVPQGYTAMSLNAFVTGASGFVGSNLVRELHQQGWNVAILARPTASLDDIADVPVTLHRGDLADADSVLRALPQHTDAVFHVAASTNVWSRHNAEQNRINVDGTRSVIEAAVKKNAGRLIYTSSFTTWGLQDALLNEHSSRSAASDWINYVRTKHLAQLLVKEAVDQGRLDAVILSPAHILGPGDRHNWSTMLRMVQRGKLPGVPPGGGSFADVREVAKAHVEAFHRGAKGETYLLGGEDASFLELIHLAGELLGKNVPARATPGWVLRSAARVKSVLAGVTGKEPDLTPESADIVIHHIHCDSSRAQRELGYRFTPIRTLLQDTIDWLLKAGIMSP
jgi:nucleoside-diphosphate-sugar epimerase